MEAYAYPTDTCAESTPLDGISVIADDVERSASYIQAFITRFRHGHLPEAAAGGNSGQQLKPVPSGHAGQIARLRDAVGTVDKLARELQTIG